VSVSRTPFRAWRKVLAIPLLCAYPVLTHASAASGLPLYAWAAWLCLSGVLCLAVPARWRLLTAFVMIAPLFLQPEALLRAPPVVINIALAVWFGSTLRAGGEPIISRFARMERGELEPDLVAYSRRLTVMWTVFFVFMAALSAALAMFGTAEAWSLFTNGINYILITAIFVGEYVYRRVRYGHYRHASLPRMIRMMFNAGNADTRRAGQK
jgi:uncharacterized membrane protein